ncbi:MAG TPA: M3 family oligoendopeptidase [Tissierellia bacterium]|nr:M3 family oligoendopeptidase [Tissierellia bacterium]
MRWSLDDLYTSFDSEEYLADIKKLDDIIEDFTKWSDANLSSLDDPVYKIETYLKKLIDYTTLFSKLTSYPSLTTSVDAKNETALKYLDKLHSKHILTTKANIKFQNFIKSLDDLDDIIEKSPFLREHSFYLKEIELNTRYLLSEDEEIIISKMKNTGSRAWSKLQNVITSTLLVDIEIDGEIKKLPLPVVRNMAYSKDAEIRKKAYEAELNSYSKIEESSAAALNGIKGEVLTTSELRGYKSPLEETLINSRMDEETLDAMLNAIREYLPYFHKYYRKKGEMLGHKNGLPFYDIFAPIGNMDRTYTYEEARDYIVKNFRTFSDRLADFAENAFNSRWIDAEPREGKRGGAFCSNIHPIKQSRILANFSGSFDNVLTLAHELGHGYHGNCLKNESILNSRYPMPIAETASIFCETIVMNAALKEAKNEEKLNLIEKSIQDAGQVIVDIYSRFLFESELFERRKDHSLSVKELKEIMLDAQKKAYGDGLDHEYLHPYMWINKTHYYYAERNFYNFPYAFGLLFSKGLYAKYLEDGEGFVKEYDSFLRATGKNSIYDVAKIMGINVHSIDFFRSSLELIRKDIEVFIALEGATGK